MSAIALGVAAALVALRCELIRDDPYTLGAISRVAPSTRPAFLSALNATRRLIGCPVGDDVVEPPPPFGGGQCSARYNFTASGTGPSSGGGGQCGPGTQNLSVGNSLWGPIGAPRRGTFFCSGDNGEASAWVVSAFGTGAQGQPDASPSDFVVLQNAYSVSLSGFTRVDGLPDDCGDLPPEYPPPIIINRDINVTFKPDLGPEITVEIPFTFSPTTVNFDGTLRIPFNFNFGGFEYSGNINLPDFNVSINPPALPPGSGEDLTDQGDDEPGTTVPPAPPDEKIIGVVVTATTIQEGRVSSYDSPGIPPIYVPRLGSIKFVYSLGGATFFSSDIDVKDRRTFVECPFPGGADAVIASPQVGVDFSFSPIRGFALATKDDVRAILDDA